MYFEYFTIITIKSNLVNSYLKKYIAIMTSLETGCLYSTAIDQEKKDANSKSLIYRNRNKTRLDIV